MKKVLFSLLILISNFIYAGPADVVVFNDSTLEAAIRTELAIPIADVTEADMALLTDLDLSGSAVTDLTGIEFATALETLDLSDTAITDLSLVAQLVSLTALDVSGTDVDSGAFLSALVNLTSLDISDSDLSDSSVLAQLTLLTSLNISGVNIADGAFLSSLGSLVNLEASNIEFTSLSSILSLSELQSLDLHGNDLSQQDVSLILSDKMKLQILILDNVNISDLNSMAHLTSLLKLSLEGNNITDISPLELLTELRLLNLTNNRLENVSVLTDLVELVQVQLNDNFLDLRVGADARLVLDELRINGVSVLNAGQEILVHFTDDALAAKVLEAVKNIDVEKQGEDVFVSDMDLLRHLFISDSDISNLTGLEHAVNLVTLDISGNAIVDLSPLKDLKNLLALVASDNKIVDVSSLFSISTLASLELDHNRLQSISGLLQLPLLNLDVENNFLDLSKGSNTLKALEKLAASSTETQTVTVNYLSQRILVKFKDERLEELVRLTLIDNSLIEDDDDVTATLMATLIELDSEEYGLTGFSEISDLEYAVNLIELTLMGDDDFRIKDISVLRGLEKLEVLDLSHNDIDNLAALEKLSQLSSLKLSDNQVSVLTPLRSLRNLLTLHLDHNEINEIGPLVSLTFLRDLKLNNNYVSELQVLGKLANLNPRRLTSVDFNDNYIMVYEDSLNDEAIESLEAAGVAVADYSSQPDVRLIYKSSDKGLQVGDDASLKMSRRSYILINYDFEGNLLEAYDIEYGKDEVGLLYKSQFDLGLETELVSGKNGAEWRYYHDGDEAIGVDGEVQVFLSGKLKAKGRVGSDINGRSIEQFVTPSLKGSVLVGGADDLDSRKRTWRLDAGLTHEANSYNPRKVLKDDDLAKKPLMDDVLMYILDVKLKKYEEK